MRILIKIMSRIGINLRLETLKNWKFQLQTDKTDNKNKIGKIENVNKKEIKK